MFDYEEAHYLTGWWKKGLIDKSEEWETQGNTQLLLSKYKSEEKPNYSHLFDYFSTKESAVCLQPD